MTVKIQREKIYCIYFQKLNKLESTPKRKEKQELFMLWQKLCTSDKVN